MGYVPEFENDVFISYAHIDDEPLTAGEKGWVSQFHHALQIRLQQLLGRELSVWRDERLQGNDHFGDALLHRFPRIAILISILSPRYLQSEWCLKELREFVTVAERTRGLRLGDRSRVFKVVKTFVPRDEHPRELQGLLGYEFFSVDPSTGRPREFLLDLGDESVRNYWAKLEDLAYDVHEMLKAIRTRHATTYGPDRAGETVYVAETTAALESHRLGIWRELQQRGYPLRPDRPLPLDGQALRAAVREQLDRASLSVHLVGPSYGVVPDGESRSIVAIQLDLAAEAAEPRHRVVWMSPDLAPTDDRQRAFVASLERDYAGRRGVEVLRTSLEDLKTFLDDRLARRASSRRPAPPMARRRVYLIGDPQDSEALRPIEDHLYHAGLEVVLSANDGDEARLRDDHQANLVECDAVLIFCGHASDLWLRAKLRDLDKSPGYGRKTPFTARAVYLGGPATPSKERFRSHETLVIRNFGAFEPADLAEFFAHLGGVPSAPP